MNLECLICYEHVAEKGDMEWLECSHSLCCTCYGKLQSSKCPFCRTAFKRVDEKLIEPVNQIVPRDYPVYQSSLRIRVRRRRRRRTLVERINNPYPIVIETSENIRNRTKSRKFIKKKKSGKNNYKKGRWAKMCGRNHGGRVACR
jgi:RecJ-like exonuclease